MSNLSIFSVIAILFLCSCSKQDDNFVRKPPVQAQNSLLLSSIYIDDVNLWKLFSYDEQNRLQQWETYNLSGDVVYRCVYTYGLDDKIKSISLKYCPSDVGGVGYVYYDANGRVDHITCEGNLLYNYKFSYNTNSTTVDLTVNGLPEETTAITITYQKDLKGDVTEENYLNHINPNYSYKRIFANYDNENPLRNAYTTNLNSLSSFFIPDFVFSNHNPQTEIMQLSNGTKDVYLNSYDYSDITDSIPAGYPIQQVFSNSNSAAVVELSFHWIKPKQQELLP